MSLILTLELLEKEDSDITGDDEFVLFQARRCELKEVIELMTRNAPEEIGALVQNGELKAVDTLAYKDDELLLTRHIVITLICEVR